MEIAGNGGVQRDFFFKPGQLSTFYDTSAPGLHLQGTRKS
jgi:hypothetical protein